MPVCMFFPIFLLDLKHTGMSFSSRDLFSHWSRFLSELLKVFLLLYHIAAQKVKNLFLHVGLFCRQITMGKYICPVL